MNRGNHHNSAPEWVVSPGLVPYEDALFIMEERVTRMQTAEAGERIWLVEHPPVITAGTSADRRELVDPGRFPVVAAGRGGRYTYHGPGQRVVYPMLDLNRRGRDVHAYVEALEHWLVRALAEFGVDAFLHEAGTGIWVRVPTGIAKIGAIGVRIRKWITFHGLAVNVTTDLSHFQAIIPCGIAGHGVARLADFVPGVALADLDAMLLKHLPFLLSAIGSTNGAGRLPAPLEAPGECS